MILGRSLARVRLNVLILLGLLSVPLFWGGRLGAQAPVPGRPSAFCHVTDGAFTTCPGATHEWSDVTPQFFQESGSYLYVDQADLDPQLGTPRSPVDTLMLMYDECRQTSRLGPHEYVRVGFTTVEVVDGKEALEHYVIHIFADGTIIFLENGVPKTNAAGTLRVPEIEGQRGAVGFGPSPNCAVDHVFAEFEIKLSATGIALDGGYSPDPQFWGAQAPCDRKCRQSKAAAVFAGLAAIATAATATPCDGFCAGLALGFGLDSAFFWYLSADPPDSNFTTIATPVVPPFTPVEVANIGTQEAADAANALLTNLSQLIGFEGALLISQERAQGAALAGNQSWERQQLLAAAQFATDVADLYDAQLVLLAHVRDTLTSAGFASVAVSPAAVSVFQQNVAANGLTVSLLNGIANTSLAARPDAAQVIRNGFLFIAPTEAAGSFPEMLTDQRMVATIQELRADHREFAQSVPGFVAPIKPGFDGNILPGNDDGSTGLVSIGFTLNFFGTAYQNLFVNNNGNVTFDAPLSIFTPFPLTSTNRAIIAPFFADVDTRLGNVVTYGQGTVDGRPAFGVNWPGVGCYSANISVLNFFQMRLIDRSDVGPGDFDIVFGYDSIQWESGQASGGNVVCQGGSSARIGYSNGTGNAGTFFELPGSGIPGAFLDSNGQTGLRHQPPLRFSVRSGVPSAIADRDGDGVIDDLDNCPTAVNPDQKDTDFDGIGDVCSVARRISTAAFIGAGLDAGTSIEKTPLRVSDAPSLTEKIVRIVQFRVNAGLTNSASQLTANLVGSLVEAGVISPDAADALTRSVLQQLDQDGDGIANSEDACPNSNLRASVVINSCDSRVPNILFSTGCTISDFVGQCAAGAGNHGGFVSCVAHLTNGLVSAGTIADAQKGAIQSCAAQAKTP
jgi:hypothetical protein